MQFIIFIAFTLLVGIVAYLATRKTDENTEDGYFLGGRSLTAPVIAASLLLTNLSTEQLVGLNGSAFNEGILVMAWETLAAIAMVVTATILLPRYLKGGLTTVPQFLERRYDTATKSITSGLFLSGYVVVLLPIVLYSGAVALIGMFDLTTVFGMDQSSTLIITVCSIGLIGSVYAIFGGLKAVAVSDTVNAVGLLIGGLMIPIFGLTYVGDGSLWAGIETIYHHDPSKFKAMGSNDSAIPFSTLFTGMMLVQLFYWGTNQAIIQRALAAKNLVEGQKGLILAAFVKILGPLIVVLPGIIAFYIFGGTLDASQADQSYGLLVNKVLPPVLLGFFAAVKTFGIVLALLSMFIAPTIANAPEGLFGYLQEINGCYSIPILTIILVGYLTKYVPAIAAKVAMGSGVILYSISQFFLKDYVIENGGTYPHFLHVMAILFLFNIGIMLLIGKLMPRAVAYEQAYTEQVDITPWSTYFIFT